MKHEPTWGELQAERRGVVEGLGKAAEIVRVMLLAPHHHLTREHVQRTLTQIEELSARLSLSTNH